MVQQINFVLNTFSLRKLPFAYTSVKPKSSDEFLLSSTEAFSNQVDKNVFVVEDVPRYFKVGLKPLPKGIRLKVIKQYPGFLIDFTNVESLDEYLASQFGRSSRYKLRRGQKKLEDSFDISYRMYFGEISRETYDFVFEEFYRLLAIRSEEKGINENINLKTKAHYFEIVYPLIQEKKASLYVIYDGKMPIDICLNFHLNDCIFQFIRTYDINYSKFNTGYTDLMKQIEWCLDNKIKFISFSKGDFYWKRRWCNTIYDYDYHIFYDSRSAKALLEMSIFRAKRQLRQFLREKKIIETYHKYRDKYKKDPDVFVPINYTDIKDGVDLEVLGQMEKINVEATEYQFLKKSVCDYLFDFNQEQEKSLELYKSKKMAKTYFIMRIHKCRQLTIN